ncbi:MAG: sigma-70 family RNA polymerase sigma factor, partial [Bacteroidales bacterium]|nr:sigma-70 family RNA polymerase sigma factor [Bacteroidales bacterium]
VKDKSFKLMEYNKQQFERLYKDHYRQMYRLSYSVLEDPEEARDAVAQVFMQIWRSKPQIIDESVTGYLLVATRNQSLHILKQRKLRMEMERELKEQREEIESNEHSELMDELKRVIEKNLTEQDKRVLSLHYDEDMTYGETAQVLGISMAAVNKHITNSLAKIRQNLKIAK